MDWKTLLLSANGRTASRPFWIGVAVLAPLSLARLLTLWVDLPLPAVQIISLINLALIYPWVCLLSKRLHDSGRTAFLILIPVVMAFLASLVVSMTMIMPMAMDLSAAAPTPGQPPDPASYAPGTPLYESVARVGRVQQLPKLAIYALFVLWAGLGRRDPAENRYGPAPAAA